MERISPTMVTQYSNPKISYIIYIDSVTLPLKLKHRYWSCPACYKGNQLESYSMLL